MKQTTQNHESNKPGRNSLCACGSGKKYKKCCLQELISNKYDMDVQKSIEKLSKRHKRTIVLDAEKMGIRKMSEVILEYANELIDAADTKDNKEKAIRLAIAAWNISFCDQKQHKEKIDKFLHSMHLEENSNDWKEADNRLQKLINKKLETYNSFDRFIVDYEFIKLKSNDYHLNVVSTICTD